MAPETALQGLRAAHGRLRSAAAARDTGPVSCGAAPHPAVPGPCWYVPALPKEGLGASTQRPPGDGCPRSAADHGERLQAAWQGGPGHAIAHFSGPGPCGHCWTPADTVTATDPAPARPRPTDGPAPGTPARSPLPLQACPVSPSGMVGWGPGWGAAQPSPMALCPAARPPAAAGPAAAWLHAGCSGGAWPPACTQPGSQEGGQDRAWLWMHLQGQETDS